jgi:nucleoside-diphosphate-sugar epimerase
MRVALTGVSGFIGSFIAARLCERGHKVTGLVRETSRRDHIEQYVDGFVVGGQADPGSWGELLDGADAVIHNSVDWVRSNEPDHYVRSMDSNLMGSIRLLDASRPLPFVFISSIAVHHDMCDRWGGEIDEDHPLRPGGDYGAYKAGVEAQLWAEHFTHGRRVCAVRPCGVYGIDPKESRSHGYTLIEKIKRGRAVTKSGGGKFVHVRDVALAAVEAAENENVRAEMVNLVDCYARWGDWGVMVNEALGTSVDVDLSSPAQPKNTFSKAVAKGLFADGPPSEFLERGHDGIRAHLAGLISQMQ